MDQIKFLCDEVQHLSIFKDLALLYLSGEYECNLHELVVSYMMKDHFMLVTKYDFIDLEIVDDNIEFLVLINQSIISVNQHTDLFFVKDSNHIYDYSTFIH